MMGRRVEADNVYNRFPFSGIPSKLSKIWMFPNIGGKTTKMDGENNGSKPYEQMDDLGVPFPLFLVQHPYLESLRFFHLRTLQGHKQYINFRSNMFQQLSSDQNLGSLLHIGDKTTIVPSDIGIIISPYKDPVMNQSANQYFISCHVRVLLPLLLN